MIEDDLSDFFGNDEFDIEVNFTSDDSFLTLNGIFDLAGTFENGMVLEDCRFVSEKSTIDKGWVCEIEGESYVVVYKVNGAGNYCEYFLENITDKLSRNVN